MSLEKIESLTCTFAEAQAQLLDVVSALKSELEAVGNKYKKPLKVRVDNCARAGLALQDAIESNADLFQIPRTQIFAGLKVGLQLGKATVSFEDEPRVIALIKKRLPEEAEWLIDTEEKVNKSALIRLDEKDLKKIDVQLIPGEDKVLIKPASGGLDKAVNAMLKDALAKAEEGA